ncbi:hypothetical protein B0H19DRAFT_1086417 [Mycena capillaripes]|nr:hypothetical protein B0H19DRAFT_1086417 [Mycena capillaripes]
MTDRALNQSLDGRVCGGQQGSCDFVPVIKGNDGVGNFLSYFPSCSANFTIRTRTLEEPAEYSSWQLGLNTVVDVVNMRKRRDIGVEWAVFLEGLRTCGSRSVHGRDIDVTHGYKRSGTKLQSAKLGGMRKMTFDPESQNVARHLGYPLYQFVICPRKYLGAWGGNLPGGVVSHRESIWVNEVTRRLAFRPEDPEQVVKKFTKTSHERDGARKRHRIRDSDAQSQKLGIRGMAAAGTHLKIACVMRQYRNRGITSTGEFLPTEYARAQSGFHWHHGLVR